MSPTTLDRTVRWQEPMNCAAGVEQVLCHAYGFRGCEVFARWVLGATREFLPVQTEGFPLRGVRPGIELRKKKEERSVSEFGVPIA